MKIIMLAILLVIGWQVSYSQNPDVTYELKIVKTFSSTKDTINLSTFLTFKISLVASDTLWYRWLGTTDSNYITSTESLNLPAGNGWYDGNVRNKLIVWGTSGTFRLWAYGRKA